MENELNLYLNKILKKQLTFKDKDLFDYCFSIDEKIKDKITKKSKTRIRRGELPYLIKTLVILLFNKYRSITKVSKILNKDHTTILYHVKDIQAKCLSDKIYDKKLYYFILDIVKKVVTNNKALQKEHWEINKTMSISFNNIPIEIIDEVKYIVNKKLNNYDSESRKT